MVFRLFDSPSMGIRNPYMAFALAVMSLDTASRQSEE